MGGREGMKINSRLNMLTSRVFVNPVSAVAVIAKKKKW
jgi:hypothetical protein